MTGGLRNFLSRLIEIIKLLSLPLASIAFFGNKKKQILARVESLVAINISEDIDIDKPIVCLTALAEDCNSASTAFMSLASIAFFGSKQKQI